MPTVRLTTCNDPIEANFMRTKLEDSGISCFLTNENSSTLLPHHNNMMNAGVQVMVSDENYEAARQLLELDVKDTVCCPKCGSEDLKMSLGDHKLRKVGAILMSLLSATPMASIKSVYMCKACQTQFSGA